MNRALQQTHGKEGKQRFAPLGPFVAKAGLTLVELVGVLALAALLFTTVALSVQNITGADLRATTNRLSSSMRGTFNRSVTRNTYLRLVIDFEENVYWTEQAEERFFTSAKKEEEDTRQFGEKSRWHATAGLLQVGGGYQIENAPGLEKDEESDVPVMHRVSARETKDSLIRRTELPRGVYFEGVMTGHQRNVKEEGRAFIYFFPNGYVQRAMIYVTDGKVTYTILTQPLTGRVVVERGRLEVPNQFDEEDKYEGSF